MRQISELEEEDFCLLESSVAPGSNWGVRTTTTGSLQLELGEELSVSVAEQLEALLEGLRTERRGRISVDSGAVSDMDSCSGTALEEDEEGVGSSSRGNISNSCSSQGSSVSCAVEDRSKVESLERGVSVSVANGPQVEFRSTARERKTRYNNEKPLPSSSSSSSSSSSHRQYVKRKGGREGILGGEGNNSRTDYSRTFTQRGGGGGSGHSRPTELRSRGPKAEVIEHPLPHRRSGESASGKSMPASLPTPDQSGNTAPREAVDREEEGSSPTEGGPFITHWGKGRWRRNGGGHDRGRRPYNSHHFAAHSGPKFSSPGVNRTRYPPQFRGRSAGYHSRPHRNSEQNSYSHRHSAGWDRGHTSQRSGSICSEGSEQQKGGDTVESQEQLRKSDRDSSPRHVGDAEKSTEVQTVRETSTEAAKNVEPTVGPDAVPATVRMKAESPGRLVSQPSGKSVKKLSYASVTSSSNGSTRTRASPNPPPESAANAEGQIPIAPNAGCTSNPNTTTSSGSTPCHRDTGNGAANTTTATTIDPATDATATTNEPTTRATATKVSTNEPTTRATATKMSTNDPATATKEPKDKPTTTTATKVSTNATTHTTATKEPKDKPTTATTATPKATGTKDHARPTDATTNSIIAASFNYSEAVEFLWKGTPISYTPFPVISYDLTAFFCQVGVRYRWSWNVNTISCHSVIAGDSDFPSQPVGWLASWSRIVRALCHVVCVCVYIAVNKSE